jgi:hypothetical protein
MRNHDDFLLPRVWHLPRQMILPNLQPNRTEEKALAPSEGIRSLSAFQLQQKFPECSELPVHVPPPLLELLERLLEQVLLL